MSRSACHRPDFVGSKFGMLTILGKHGLTKSQHLLVLCRCDCGGEIVAQWGHLRKGNTKSCGCICKARVIDIQGQRFNRLVVLQRAGSVPKSHALWRCLCDCGNEVVCAGVYLRKGSIQSCGCVNTEQRSALGKRTVRGAIEAHTRAYGMSAFRELIALYKRGATGRGRVWSLTDHQAFRMFKANCQYCDRSPSQICGKKANNGKFIYNGIDRVDSTKDYTMDNVVPCCQWCNWIKGRHPLAMFYENVARIARHHPEILKLPSDDSGKIVA